ncbi:desiccation-related protein PCC13-62-like [Chenopodium quinoa]|uniref:desiccation-related protein PCC13-62-like n=1 Tax=Chenopodium quinoa TaxID=63459 RepID=UPI000B7802FE|nr:desiccation-related protein PCC13-62-like [Chenopodium quinoa]
MSIIVSKLPSLSISQMLLVILIFLGSIRLVYPSIDLNPFDRIDVLTLLKPVYDTNDPNCQSPNPPGVHPVYNIDINLLQFAQNIEHLEADFFLWGALGFGLDEVAPELTLGGPPPIGVRKANLNNLTENIIKEFAYEEIGHLRIIKKTVGGLPRPLMDLSPNFFAKIVNKAFERDLEPPFDPYRDNLSYMLASYIIPYLGLNGYVGANSQIKGYASRRLLAGLLGVESGQDAVIRTYLYERQRNRVQPYNFTVAEFTNRISTLRNNLGKCGVKDEGIVVPPELGAEGNSSTNILSANADSISYARSPEEILRILYDTGDERVPGGFYPKGGNGQIARSYL